MSSRHYPASDLEIDTVEEGVSPTLRRDDTHVVNVALLGPVELTSSQGGKIDVPSRRQRQLLVILGLSVGHVVDTERIADLVWGDGRPANPAATVQTHISRLRRLLDPPVAIETEPSGYMLVCPDDLLDLLRFERLVIRLRSEQTESVPRLATRAFELWRGPPFIDIDHPDIELERQRFVGLRLELTEILTEALYVLGRHVEAIALLEQHVRDNPYRERPVATLMRCLFTAARQADALRVFADLRLRLLDGLGVDPSLELRNLEMSILRQEVDGRYDSTPGWVEIENADRVGESDETPGQEETPSAISQRIRICTTADRVRLAYAESGSGPPLVKAANWMTHLDYDWESPVWRHWNEGLSRHHTLVRYDERGCGLSDWEVDRFGFDAWVDDLASVVDALGLEHFPLLGISQGGAVAIAYAVAHPERVSHLILCGAYGRGRLVRASDEAQRREADLHLELARIGWGTGDATFRQVFTSQFMPDGTRDQWEAFNELQRRTCSVENAVRFMEVFANIDVIDLATQVRCPTLVLHSRSELRVPFEMARELATLIPQSQLVPLESRNHILLESEPAWSRFLHELDLFLSDPP